MPLAEFLYTTVPIPPTPAFPNGQQVLRPWVFGVIAGPAPDHHLGCRICLDTGADNCVFPLSFAERLGFDLKTMPMSITQGATGQGEIYYGDVSISIPLGPEDGDPELTVETRAGFTEGLDAQGIGLLGQIGFFDKYDVSFKYREGRFYVRF